MSHLLAGPKTPIGRARSAKNSRKHGLSSQDIVSAEEKCLYENFLKALIKEYNLTSLLEICQAKRLAIAHAKSELSNAYEQQLLNNYAKRVKKDVLEHLHDYFFLTPVVRGMLQEIFKFGQLGLPCGLTPIILDAICQEYAELTTELVDEDAYQEALPVLHEFLKRYEFSQTMDYSFEKLKSMNSILTAALDRGESYSEYASQFFAELFPMPRATVDVDGMNELEAFILEQQESRLKQRNNYSFVQKKLPEYPSRDQLNAWMKPFFILQQSYRQAWAMKPKIDASIESKLSIISLPEEEADRIRKYQHHWSKKYSDLLNELIALIRERDRLQHV